MTLDKCKEFFYPGIKSLGISPIDGTLRFYSISNHLCPKDAVVLDFGAGRGVSFSKKFSPFRENLLSFKPLCSVRVGCDVDPVVMENPSLDKAYVLNSDSNYKIPTENSVFDLVNVDWVVEHLPDPISTFREIYRVLKPGGWICIRTPNLLHYSYLSAYFLRDSFLEKKILKIVQPDREEEDVFPKFYKANTSRSLTSSLIKAGYSNVVLSSHEPEPAYLSFSVATLILGSLYQRVASSGLLPRACLMAFGQKIKD